MVGDLRENSHQAAEHQRIIGVASVLCFENKAMEWLLALVLGYTLLLLLIGLLLSIRGLPAWLLARGPPTNEKRLDHNT